MPILAHLYIAGVTFRLHGPAGWIIEEKDPAYASFWNPTVADALSFVDVRINPGRNPNPLPAHPVFAPEESWAAFREGDIRWFRLQPPPFAEPIWEVRMEMDPVSVAVYCGPDLILQRGDRLRLSNPLHYPLDQILLMHCLAPAGGLLLHAAGLTVNGGGYLFAGKSGAGKSTISRLLGEQDGVSLLNDDRLVLRPSGDGFRMYGTPWPGELGIAHNNSSLLRGMCFLCQSQENRLVSLTPSEAMERLLPVASIPWYDSAIVDLLLPAIEKLVHIVPAFDFHFLREPAAAGFLLRSLRSE